MATNERMLPIQPDKWTAEQKQAAEEFQAGRGYAVSGPFAVMLRSPEVMLRAKAMGDYLRFRNVLPKRVSEMVILITAREWTQQYEWSYHYGFALEAGLAKPIVEAIAHGRRPDAMAEDQDLCEGAATVRRAGGDRPDRRQRLLQPARHDDERGAYPARSRQGPAARALSGVGHESSPPVIPEAEAIRDLARQGWREIPARDASIVSGMTGRWCNDI
jgi:hypothetical protein